MTGGEGCVYFAAYIGRCGRDANLIDGIPLCDQHAGKLCWCGAQAVRECSVAVSFVCGQRLCADHGCHHVAYGLTGSPGAKHDEKGYQQWFKWKSLKESRE